MLTEYHVVDNRVFLLGLDKLYRDAMKPHERGELLRCARRVAEAVYAVPADGPVEGYYAEDAQLTEYFHLVRALQDIDESATSSVESLPEFLRLRDVVSAPLYGHPQDNSKLLPTGRDALSQALLDIFPEWTIKGLTAAAYKTAKERDDISLVGLAARIQDAVVLTATRESVVLYAHGQSAIPEASRPQYVWTVDTDLAQHARTFIDTFNALFDEKLPPPNPAQAERYWHAYDRNKIVGRCVRLGHDPGVRPIRHYHWAIRRSSEGEFVVQDFWKPEVWSTTRYRSALESGEHPEP